MISFEKYYFIAGGNGFMIQNKKCKKILYVFIDETLKKLTKIKTIWICQKKNSESN